jgi:hypothetical protein
MCWYTPIANLRATVLTPYAFFYYCQPPHYRFDAVPLLLFNAGCVGDGVGELAVNGGAP